ncbi:tether containing UBX domain for GLUT4 isoform X1 [Rhincodon typus]|uniref:tether containing UBX domain for GLUT4 isoform X1 n=2 Tax=Rhincodon typus TaxID=259920 RepID=UPI0020303B59|nr:tether containing UBX domain for GLUT4 isoform X1 [Rhincodon typus]
MAMMAAAVTVLAPNGRRQQVRVAASTPLLQVLEEVCRKQKLDPKEYGLKFQRTILDLSQQWRFANVPNNAKLEMVATARRHAGTESKVRIALQLEDGSRLQYLFQSGLTLWDLLDHFPETRISEEQLLEAIPICVYMRDEIAGESALKATTLKSLGLTDGSAIIRYVLKRSNVDAQNKAMDLASISDKQPVNKSESKTVLIKVVDGSATEPGSVCSVDDSSPNGLSTEINLHRTMEEFAEKKVPSMDLTQERSKDNTDPFEKKDEDKLSAEQIRSESSENPSDGSAQLVAPDSSCPSEYSEVSDCSASSTKNNGSLALTSFPTGGQDLANSGMDRNQFNLDEPSKATAHSSTSAGPPHPKKSKTVPQQSPLKSSENIEPLKLEPLESSSSKEYLKPVDREPLVYHLDGKNPVQEPSDFEELPDEFFQVTIDDVRKRFAQLKSERRRLEEAPLMTKSMRETYIKEKTERYPKVVLRVQFPDRYVLQGFFRPFETVGALIEFVKMHLIDPAISFYLFKTPPKVLLDQPAATLFEANLFPAALVHFGSEVRMDCYICEEFVKSPTSMSQADLTITSCIPRQVTPSTSSLSCETAVQSPAQSGEEVGERKQPMTHAASAREVQTDSSKVPKWFKLPGKR